jgi:hypothetical protein
VTDISEVIGLLAGLNEAEQRQAFAFLRQRIPIHRMEQTLMAPAELILEAIARASDLTVRGVEGIIAEASFTSEVVPTLKGWQSVPYHGDVPFDALLTDGVGDPIRVQVKMQRREKRVPLMASEVMKKRKWPNSYYVVETQKTRAGKDENGESTRPYKFGSFDILAVSLGASQGRWSAFLYTVASWLLPQENDETKLLTYQPVPPTSNDWWTHDFLTCVGWLRSDKKGRIGENAHQEPGPLFSSLPEG